MIEPTDDDIAEALRLSGYAFTPECVGDVRQELCMRHSLILTHARTIDQRNKLVEALEKITDRDLLEISGYHTRKWRIPATGSEYESRDPIFKRDGFQNAKDFQAIARQALAARGLKIVEQDQ